MMFFQLLPTVFALLSFTAFATHDNNQDNRLIQPVNYELCQQCCDALPSYLLNTVGVNSCKTNGCVIGHDSTQSVPCSTLSIGTDGCSYGRELRLAGFVSINHEQYRCKSESGTLEKFTYDTSSLISKQKCKSCCVDADTKLDKIFKDFEVDPCSNICYGRHSTAYCLSSDSAETRLGCSIGHDLLTYGNYQFREASQLVTCNPHTGIITPTFTSSPITIPTKYQTAKPSFSPTQSPTLLPTNIPTKYPTSKPTKYPTDKPTASPTQSPTLLPTDIPTKYPTSKPTKYPTLLPTSSPTKSPTSEPTSSPTVSPTSEPTSSPTETNCTIELCGTPEIYYPIDSSSSFHTRMDSCCPVSPHEACPKHENLITSFTRSQGSNMSYCKNTVEGIAPFKTSCKDKDELQVRVMFMKEESTECCLECTCFGDPRCYSFDGTFEEFVLCDGRAIPDNNSTEDRCIIRKNTCEEQKDHEGNSCIWANPKTQVPNYSNSYQQKVAEEDFNVAKYGSPCNYNEAVSNPSVISMYKVADFEFKIVQKDRGYIQKIFLNTAIGSYNLNVSDCLSGNNFTTTAKYSNSAEDYFSKIEFGSETLWTVIDSTTNIEISIRCTGVFNDGAITVPFMNIEYIREPDEIRAISATGFCAKNVIEEKFQSTWEHSVYITNNNFCDNYNLLMTPIILRNTARAIINYPGLSTLGTEWAYTDFCERFFAPRYSSVQNCVSAFMTSSSVNNVIKAFCKAVTLESSACIENLQMNTDTSGYEEAFNQARIQYVETYDEICTVLSSSDLLQYIPGSDKCKVGVELQYKHPVNGWTTYKAFPTDEPPCNGFIVDFNYKNDKVLFEYPIRMTQMYFPKSCSACEYISTADTWYQFTAA